MYVQLMRLHVFENLNNVVDLILKIPQISIQYKIGLRLKY